MLTLPHPTALSTPLQRLSPLLPQLERLLLQLELLLRAWQLPLLLARQAPEPQPNLEALPSSFSPRVRAI